MLPLAQHLPTLVDHYPWLDFVLTPLDERMRKHIAEAASHLPRALDELQFEEHLQRAGTLIDRCFVQRREWQELCSNAITHALTFERFKALVAIEQSLEESSWTEQVRDAERDGHVATKAAFGSMTAELATGFKAAAAGAESAATAGLTGDKQRRQLVSDKWEVEIAHQSYLNSLHEMEGGIFNFSERAKRVEDILLEDLREAYHCMVAANDGLRSVYKELPAWMDFKTSRKPLEDMLRWVRDTMRNLEQRWSFETDREFVLSLKSTKWVDAGQIIEVCDQVTDQGVTGQDLVLNFLNIGLSGIRHGGLYELANGRVTQIGLSFALKNAAGFAENRLLSFSAMLTKEKPRARRPVFFSGVGLHQAGAPLARTRDSAIRNVTVEGEWTLQLYNFQNGNGAQPFELSDIADIFLHITLSISPYVKVRPPIFTPTAPAA